MIGVRRIQVVGIRSVIEVIVKIVEMIPGTAEKCIVRVRNAIIGGEIRMISERRDQSYEDYGRDNDKSLFGCHYFTPMCDYWLFYLDLHK